MRKANVLINGIEAGLLTEESANSYLFRYDDVYFADDSKPEISLTLPKTHQEYRSQYLFPFFFNMLSEGANRQAQSRMLKIDENDHFGLLLATAQENTIGAVTIEEIK